jgi:hypothetical protein
VADPNTVVKCIHIVLALRVWRYAFAVATSAWAGTVKEVEIFIAQRVGVHMTHYYVLPSSTLSRIHRFLRHKKHQHPIHTHNICCHAWSELRVQFRNTSQQTVTFPSSLVLYVHSVHLSLSVCTFGYFYLLCKYNILMSKYNWNKEKLKEWKQESK